LADLPVEVTARLLFGTLTAGATLIARADDPKKAGAEVSSTIIRMLERLRGRRDTDAADKRGGARSPPVI